MTPTNQQTIRSADILDTIKNMDVCRPDISFAKLQTDFRLLRLPLKTEGFCLDAVAVSGLEL